MDPALAMGASGALGLVGTLMTNSANEQMTAENDQTQIQLQNQAEAYNTQMSNTSYQRGTADMKAAGINPMLAVSNGGASTPTAPMANTQAGHADNAVGNALASAQQGAQVATAMNAQQSQADVNKTQAASNAADTANTTQDTKLKDVATQAAQAQLQAVQTEANLRTANAQTGLKYQGYDQFVNRAKQFSGALGSAAQGAAALGGLP